MIFSLSKIKPRVMVCIQSLLSQLLSASVIITLLNISFNEHNMFWLFNFQAYFGTKPHTWRRLFQLVGFYALTNICKHFSIPPFFLNTAGFQNASAKNVLLKKGDWFRRFFFFFFFKLRWKIVHLFIFLAI